MELVSFDIILNQTKMKNIKNIVIGIFAVVGFAAIVTGFTNEAVQEHSVPESHVWEMVVVSNAVSFLYSTITKELFSRSKQSESILYFSTLNSDSINSNSKIDSVFFSTNACISFSSLKGTRRTSSRLSLFKLYSSIP